METPCMAGKPCMHAYGGGGDDSKENIKLIPVAIAIWIFITIG